MTDSTPNATPKQADWSLRANGDTYIDQDRQSEQLVDRLLNSSASVTGIAGQRGAGKSSLALHALNNLKRRGAFTQLIHSPTDYDAREFLVSVLQQVCEQIVTDTNAQLGQANTLLKRGRIASLRQLVYLLLATLILVVLANVLSRTTSQIIAFVPRAVPDLTIDAVLRLLVEFFPSFVFLSCSLLSMFVIRTFVRLAHALPRPRQTGLQDLALELSERLSFQSTRSVSAQAGLSITKLTSGLNLAKSLSDRPLSLPGLASQFTQFMDKVAEVHDGRVVICLDELDKIEKPEELDKLLRGIKGVLGHPKTHFILTVSEDALARFAAQRKNEQGIVESAFDNIVYLPCAELNTIRHMTTIMAPDSRLDDTAIGLLWLFGHGVPREIKRNIRACLEVYNARPFTAPPLAVWRSLFALRLSVVQEWTLSYENRENAYEFLVCVHNGTTAFHNSTTCASDRAETPYDHAWAKRFVAMWLLYIEETLSSKSQDPPPPEFVRIAVDMLLGVSGLVHALEKRPPSKTELRSLRHIFTAARSNLRFAAQLLLEYMEQLELVDRGRRRGHDPHTDAPC